MKRLVNICALTFHLLLAAGCHSDAQETPEPELEHLNVDFGTRELAVLTRVTGAPVLVVFEAGLGDDHSVWRKIIQSTSADVVVYDRAGYGDSDSISKGEPQRDILQLSKELGSVIDEVAGPQKVILVGHSLGGMIIRASAVSDPSRIAGLLFVDASHEAYNQPTQAEEDAIFSAFSEAYGAESGAALESSQLVEDSDYMSTLGNLPDVPTIVLTSMRIDTQHDAEDRQEWFDSKEQLRSGVSDFRHVTTVDAGHYIMLEQPQLVIDALDELLNKIN